MAEMIMVVDIIQSCVDILFATADAAKFASFVS